MFLVMMLQMADASHMHGRERSAGDVCQEIHPTFQAAQPLSPKANHGVAQCLALQQHLCAAIEPRLKHSTLDTVLVLPMDKIGVLL
jgi:hypothetical protein